MKIVAFSLILLVSVVTLSFQLSKHEKGNLKITVTELKNSDGEIDFNLFNSSDGFPGDGTKTLKHLRGKINKDNCSVTFENLPFGKYAISIYHDENNDKKFNKSWYGKPIEGVAVSNNAKGSITGPPSFEEAKFDFNAQKNNLIIKMNYF
ncbi:MAG TPA: DUF2141 domain-containing protein [Cytophagaceae bacterium]|jgi:uncharacterized protein (DUF2141 family)|nr:DUF2141 domain-containing protein [Cytophagaceae bacterium]